MQYEVFTIGGGRFLFQFFGAVAAITQSTAFDFAVTAAMLISLGWVLFMLAFEPAKWDRARIWLAGTILMIAALLNITATVKITDRINRVDSTGYIIANVPLGLAGFAGITSHLGDEITRLIETNFADVKAPHMRDHGFLFGVRLLSRATQIEIRDELFAQSLSSFIRNCLFYDIMLGRKTARALKEATDPWAYASSEPSIMRMFEIYTANSSGGWSSQIKTCAAGVADLNKGWTNAVKIAQKELFVLSSPTSDRVATATLQAQIQTELGSFHDYLIGASRNSADILKRQMAINAILDEPANWMSEVGNTAALNNYINARLDLQTEQSYRATARQAEKWVPNLKAVFQCIYYGAFPIAFLMMLSPMGLVVLRNYFFGLIWIESWGPLYAIMNYIMTAQAKERMHAVISVSGSSSGDIPLFAQAGIQAVEADISVMAGYLSMSIPFLAIALVAGAGRFASLATSTLAVTQEAVADTTRESATGNLSIGNTGYGNHSFHQTSGFSHDTNPSYMSSPGYSAARADSGAVVAQTADGRTVVSHGGGWSSLPTDLHLANSLSASYSQQAADAQSAASGYSTQHSSLQQSSAGWSESLAQNITSGNTSGISYTTGEGTSSTQDFKTLSEAAKTFSENNGYKEQELLQAAMNASVAAKLFGTGAEGKLAYENQNTNSVSFEDAVRFSQQEQVSDALSRVISANSTETASWSDGSGVSFTDAQQAAYNELESLAQNRDATLQDVTRFEEARARVEQNSASVSQSLVQPFVRYIEQQDNGYGGMMGATGAANLLVSDQASDIAYRQQLAQNFIREQIADNPDFAELTVPNFVGAHAQNTKDISLQAGNLEARASQTATDISAGSEQISTRLDADMSSTKDVATTKLANAGDQITDGREDITKNSQSAQHIVHTKTDTNLPDQAKDTITKTAFGAASILGDGVTGVADIVTSAYIGAGGAVADTEDLSRQPYPDEMTEWGGNNTSEPVKRGQKQTSPSDWGNSQP